MIPAAIACTTQSAAAAGSARLSQAEYCPYPGDDGCGCLLNWGPGILTSALTHDGGTCPAPASLRSALDGQSAPWLHPSRCPGTGKVLWLLLPDRSKASRPASYMDRP